MWTGHKTALATIILTVVASSLTCNAGWDANIWPATGTSPRKYVYSTIETNIVGTNSVIQTNNFYAKDMWSWQCYSAVVERATILETSTSSIAFYRSERDNIISIKGWIVTNCTNFVDRTKTDDGKIFDNWFLTQTNQNVFPVLTVTGMISYLSLPTNFFTHTPYRDLGNYAGTQSSSVITNITYSNQFIVVTCGTQPSNCIFQSDFGGVCMYYCTYDIIDIQTNYGQYGWDNLKACITNLTMTPSYYALNTSRWYNFTQPYTNGEYLTVTWLTNQWCAAYNEFCDCDSECGATWEWTAGSSITNGVAETCYGWVDKTNYTSIVNTWDLTCSYTGDCDYVSYEYDHSDTYWDIDFNCFCEHKENHTFTLTEYATSLGKDWYDISACTKYKDSGSDILANVYLYDLFNATLLANVTNSYTIFTNALYVITTNTGSAASMDSELLWDSTTTNCVVNKSEGLPETMNLRHYRAMETKTNSIWAVFDYYRYQHDKTIPTTIFGETFDAGSKIDSTYNGGGGDGVLYTHTYEAYTYEYQKSIPPSFVVRQPIFIFDWGFDYR